MNNKISQLGLAALMAASCGAALESCASSKGQEAKNGIADATVGDDIDAGYMTLSDAELAAAAQTNEFAVNLFRTQAGQDSKVVSPVSVAYLLGMLANGADGATKDEIMQTLCMDGTSLQTLNETYKAIINMASRLDRRTKINIANCIAVNKQIALNGNYVSAMQSLYDARVESVDFASPNTLAKINGWCAKQTDGMIPEIVDALDPGTAAVLMNAIYFNGTWANKFDKAGTQTAAFRGYTRDIKKVPMMHQNHKFMYTDNSDYAAVTLPYGNGAYAMTVILPAEGKSTADIAASLSAKSLTDMWQSMDECQVDLKLPRFSTTTETPLNKPVSDLGAPSMFVAGKADFSKMADAPLFVSVMLQKAKIEVSEEGTKAAAVTAAVMMMTSLQPDMVRRVNFHADRPFIYVITERSTNTVFFMGQYTGDTGA